MTKWVALLKEILKKHKNVVSLVYGFNFFAFGDSKSVLQASLMLISK
jgi:hypothetical protein